MFYGLTFWTIASGPQVTLFNISISSTQVMSSNDICLRFTFNNAVSPEVNVNTPQSCS